MKSKKFIAVVTALLCMTAAVSCGKKSPKKEEVSSDSAVNTVDEKATEEGKVPSYKVTENYKDYTGEILSQTVTVCNKFDDPLTIDKTAYSEHEDSSNVSYEYKYNSDGLVLRRLSDGYRSHESFCTYDSHGELLTSESLTEEQEIEYKFRYENQYGDDGKLSVVTCCDEKNGDEIFSTGFYTYDESGNISEYEVESGNSGNSTLHTYEYDENGNAVKERTVIIKDGEESGSGSEYISTYNSRNLPEKKELYVGGTLFYTYEYEYEFYN